MAEEVLTLAAAQEKPFDLEDFLTYRVGVKDAEGDTVTGIISVGDRFIVYSVSESFVSKWRVRDVSVEESTRLNEVEYIRAEAENKLKNVYSDTFDMLYVSAVCAILGEHENDDVEGRLGALRDSIASLSSPLKVIQASRRVRIWFGEDLSVEVLVKNPGEIEKYAIEQYRQMEVYRELICPDALPESGVKKISLSLGVALHSALGQSDKEQVDKIFDGFKRRVEIFVANSVKSKYLLLTVSFGAILISAFSLAFNADFIGSKTVLVPLIGGVLGALLSTVSRSNSIEVSEQNPDHIILLQGALRVLVGGAFAVVGFACVEANLALGMFKGELYSLLVLGVVCGFSERLVPDLIGGLSSAK